jgi:hypothetical protein
MAKDPASSLRQTGSDAYMSSALATSIVRLCSITTVVYSNHPWHLPLKSRSAMQGAVTARKMGFDERVEQ